MRSDVVKVKRDADGIFMGEEEERSVYDMLSDLLPEIKDNETKSVRISVEIVGEKGEEKVGSKAALRHEGNTGLAYLNNIRCPTLDFIVKTWRPYESRDVKSINFDTPSGVPDVTFIETPRERLKRSLKESENMVFPEQFRHIAKECQVYLDATEEAAKKGGG